MMFELRSDEKKYPIRFERFEEAAAMIQLVKSVDDKDLFLTGDIPDDFDMEYYLNYIHQPMGPKFFIDYYILSRDVAQLEQKEDFGVMFAPIFEENAILVDQYKSGNEKALNALMGKFLKSNKGYDPKEVKEELIKILGG
jgi:Asp-tRNA(Asn)/Glu-tRNA(Gln) amidotransferase B subunit